MRSGKGKRLDVILAVSALFFLVMGLTELRSDRFGALMGLGGAIPLAAVYVWRKLREARGRSVQTGFLSVLLFCAALFFLLIGITGFAGDPTAVIIGFVVGLPLAACYLLRRLRELREADAQAAAQPVAREPLQGRVGKPAVTQRKKPIKRPPPPVTVCPHCGAPGMGDLCEYCGMSKKT